MKYYFLGICGTAMASLAILLKQKGHEVWGSDQNAYPPISDLLKLNNIEVIEGFHPENLKRPFDRAIIGNALSRGNPEVEEILNQNFPFASLPETIRKEFIENKTNIVVTGTHGKTTTTALMSWVLKNSGLSPTFLIGGISRNFQTSAELGEGEFFVIEGDEYDSAFFDKRPKFMHYFPYYLIINNIEYDHSDIYQDLHHIISEFQKLIRTVPQKGLIVANGDDPNVRKAIEKTYSRVCLFGKSPNNDWSFKNVKSTSNGMEFSVLKNNSNFGDFSLPLFGTFQIYNALAVIAVAHDIGLDTNQIQAGFKSFLNVKRRLEYWGKLNGALFYDDFAHHPTAIRETLRAIKIKHPDKRIIVVFEPRTNTTVKNIFQKQIGEALSIADIVIISPIYRAKRIPPKEQLSLEILKKDLENSNTKAISVSNYPDIANILKKYAQNTDIIILMTNGNLGGEYAKIRQMIQN